MTVAPSWRAHSATSGSSHTTATGSGALAATTRSAMDRTRSIRIASVMVPPSRRLAWRNPLTGISTTSGPNEAPGRVGSGRGGAEPPADTFYSVRGRASGWRGGRRLLVVSDRVAVIGAGSWGTAVASLTAGSFPTSLWVRSPELASSIGRTRENGTYLAGVHLPDALTATSSLEEAVAGASVVFMAVPSHGFRAVLSDLAPLVAEVEAVISLSKGIENGTNLRMSEVIAEVVPDVPAGVLTGTNLAREVADGQPAASVVALPDEALARRVQNLVHTRTFRVYMGTDVVGCEIAGATKNVMAIAAGICDGLGFGENTRAVLITRGLAELGRLGVALGGKVL